VVQVGGLPPGLQARAVVFDSHDDVAVLRVPGLAEPALTMNPSAPAGTAGGILGYPLDGPFVSEPGRIGHTEPVNTEDAYGNGPVLRTITTLRGLVRPGNSGGPIVDAHGRVLATVFAAVVGSAQHGGFAVPDSVVAAQLARARRRTGTVGTGPCSG
jgi:S1-C subfamily serine protease